MKDAQNHFKTFLQGKSQAVSNLLRQVFQIYGGYARELAKNGRNWNLFYAAGKKFYKEKMFYSHFLSVLPARKLQETVTLQYPLCRIKYAA